MEKAQVLAAQYVRMSTDLQQFSIENQKSRIGEFAKRNGFKVVQTYSDPGKSGVRIQGRDGLSTLISDIISKRAEYSALLVYDISRWGRFQDIDEAAHYEFLCRSNGVAVHYCVEPFTNDGSIYSELLKGIKRAMAAEYSRELGVRAYEGQKHLAQLGFKMGGACGFGLRRVEVSFTGKRKRVLRRGEQKVLLSDHVIQISGPESEMKLVRRLYRMALTKPSRVILEALNREGIKYNDGKNWTLNRLNGVLTNIKYTGCNVWGRVTVKLYGKKRKIPQEDWIFGPPTFKAIVSRELYKKVQAARRSRWAPANKLSNEQLLQQVSSVLELQGRLSSRILTHAGVSLTRLYNRFGNLSKVYELLGYKCTPHFLSRVKRGAVSRRIREDVIARLIDLHGDRIIRVKKFPKASRETIVIDGKIPLAVQTTICHRTKHGFCWKVTPRAGDSEQLALICKVDRANQFIEAFYVVAGIANNRSLNFREDSPWLKAAVPLTDLNDLIRVATQVRGANCNSPSTLAFMPIAEQASC